jgi:hypothetical protein
MLVQRALGHEETPLITRAPETALSDCGFGSPLDPQERLPLHHEAAWLDRALVTTRTRGISPLEQTAQDKQHPQDDQWNANDRTDHRQADQ